MLAVVTVAVVIRYRHTADMSSLAPSSIQACVPKTETVANCRRGEGHTVLDSVSV
jgi:hypothetical protein